MSVATIELEGDALYGVGPTWMASDTVAGENYCALLDQLPTSVRLGRIRPQAQPMCLNLSSYFSDADLAAAPLPASINRRDRAAKSLARMYKNDQYGCCVISGKMHAIGLWSAVDSDSGGEVEATDQEVVSQYQSFCGPGDRGCNISSVLNIIRSKGIVAGGKNYKIDSYVRVDNTKKDLVKAALYLFGATTIGIDLPSAWKSASVWDVTSSRIVGGHDVTPIDYDDQGVYVSSWGRVYLMTWAAFLSTNWVGEFYALLAPLWYGNDRIAPTGMNVEQMVADLAKLSNGVVPDIVDPLPPGPDLEPYMIRLTKPQTKGAHGDFILGSDLAAGDYDVILAGNGGPPPVP